MKYQEAGPEQEARVDIEPNEEKRQPDCNPQPFPGPVAFQQMEENDQKKERNQLSPYRRKSRPAQTDGYN